MSQVVERMRAVKLARKLMEQTTERGRTEGEMEQAMSQLAKIKTTFDLTLDEIVLSTMEYKQGDVVGLDVKGDPMSEVTYSIGIFTDTKRWRTHGKGKYMQGYSPRGYSCMKRVATGPQSYHFFGLVEDVEMAVYLFDMIKSSLQRAVAEFMVSPEYQRLTGMRGAKKSALYTFKQAFASRIGSRLSEMAYAQQRTERTARKAAGMEEGTELTVSRKQVREAKFDEQVGIKLVSGGRSHRTGGNSMTGYNAGRSSANNVSLNTPVSGPRQSGPLLLA